MSDRPDARQVAGGLDTTADRLRRFVEVHPAPSPAAVLGAFGGDPELEDTIAEWLDEYLAEQKRRRARRDPHREVGE